MTTNSLGESVPVLGPGGQPVAVIDPNTGRAVQNASQTDMYNPWCVGSLTDSDEWFSPKVIMDWAVTDNATAYFSWSRARKPGGFSLLTVGSSGLNRDLTEFEPEKMEVWEVGAKTAWLDNTLIANGAFFFQDFTDKQALTSALGNDGRLVSKIVNAGSAEVWGTELGLAWSPASEFLGGDWFLRGSHTWLPKREYTDFTIESGSSVNAAQAGNCSPTIVGGSNLCTLSYTGNTLEDAPEHAFVGFIGYTRPMNTGVDAYVETDIFWQDRRYTDQTNLLWTDAYWNLDFRVGLRSDRWEALLYVNNVLDDDTVQMTGGGPGLGCCFVLGSSIDLAGTNDYTQAVPTEPVDSDNPDHAPRSAGANVMVDLPLFSTAFLPPPRVVGVRLTYRFGG
jgi:outer membrane receptor protein involved in Fe transport